MPGPLEIIRGMDRMRLAIRGRAQRVASLAENPSQTGDLRVDSAMLDRFAGWCPENADENLEAAMRLEAAAAQLREAAEAQADAVAVNWERGK